jgi:hypothetical protein
VERPAAPVDTAVTIETKFVAPRENADAFIRDLVRNAPNYIQSRERDNIDDSDSSDAIDEFLSTLENI